MHRAVLAAATAANGPVWVAAANGAITSPVGSPDLGQPSGPLAAPVVGAAATADGAGYWLVASDGGIFSYGTARFFGSTGGLHLDQPIVGMAPTPTGRGYWLVASDGGIFSYGDARFFGSTGAVHLDRPIVGMAPTPDGGGYWLVASDGGIFSFGTARFFGSTGGVHLDQPVIGMAATPAGDGYWLVASDGGVFTFGGAAFHGSLGAAPTAPVRGMAADRSGGYWLIAADGTVTPFGLTGARPPVAVASGPPAPVTPPPDVAGEAAVAFAEAQVGKPYVYGATGPGSYDCSGLALASWAAAGVALQRTAAEQYGDGTHVAVGDVQPGDLVFWSGDGSPSGIYHVGIALGGGMMVAAPVPGEDVSVQAIYGGVYPVATRP